LVSDNKTDGLDELFFVALGARANNTLRSLFVRGLFADAERTRTAPAFVPAEIHVLDFTGVVERIGNCDAC